MNIYEASNLRDMDVKSSLAKVDFHSQYCKINRPVIIDKVADSWSFIREWNITDLGMKVKKVRIQRPSEYGVYHFLKFEQVGYDEFLEKILKGEKVYLSANQILGEGGRPVNEDSFGALSEDLSYIDYIDKEDMYSANLWIGPGGNRTLLHFDPWHSFIVMVEGRKKVVTYHPSQTEYLHPYRKRDIPSIYAGRMMDSKVNPEEVQEEYVRDVRNAEGYYGEIRKGQIMFIPAGSWHYVESHDVNIAVNYFYNAKEEGLLDKPPLRDYYLKKKYIMPLVECARATKNIFSRMRRSIMRRESR